MAKSRRKKKNSGNVVVALVIALIVIGAIVAGIIIFQPHFSPRNVNSSFFRSLNSYGQLEEDNKNFKEKQEKHMENMALVCGEKDSDGYKAALVQLKAFQGVGAVSGYFKDNYFKCSVRNFEIVKKETKDGTEYQNAKMRIVIKTKDKEIVKDDVTLTFAKNKDNKNWYMSEGSLGAVLVLVTFN